MSLARIGKSLEQKCKYPGTNRKSEVLGACVRLEAVSYEHLELYIGNHAIYSRTFWELCSH